MIKSTRVSSNLLKQNCYVRDCAVGIDLKDGNEIETYDSLDETLTDRGIEFEIRSYPYPITPAFVNSFVDSSDYRRDPVNAVANSVKRLNLGDISDCQRILNLDSAAQKQLYLELSKKFGSYNSVNSNNKVGDSNE